MVTYEYHGRIRKKSPQKQIQVFCSLQGAYFLSVWCPVAWCFTCRSGLAKFGVWLEHVGNGSVTEGFRYLKWSYYTFLRLFSGGGDSRIHRLYPYCLRKPSHVLWLRTSALPVHCCSYRPTKKNILNSMRCFPLQEGCNEMTPCCPQDAHLPTSMRSVVICTEQAPIPTDCLGSGLGCIPHGMYSCQKWWDTSSNCDYIEKIP